MFIFNKRYIYRSSILDASDKIIVFNICNNFINDVFKKHKKDTMTNHDYEHIKEDFFKNINIEDVNYIYINKNMELRKLKLNKLLNDQKR